MNKQVLTSLILGQLLYFSPQQIKLYVNQNKNHHLHQPRGFFDNTNSMSSPAGLATNFFSPNLKMKNYWFFRGMYNTH